MDFVGPTPQDWFKNDMLLNPLCVGSNYPKALPQQGREAAIARVSFISMYPGTRYDRKPSCPRTLYSDNDTAFEAEFKEHTALSKSNEHHSRALVPICVPASTPRDVGSRRAGTSRTIFARGFPLRDWLFANLICLPLRLHGYQKMNARCSRFSLSGRKTWRWHAIRVRRLTFAGAAAR